MTPRQALARYPLFAVLEDSSLDDWISAGSEFIATPGETLVKAGTPGLWIHVILEGRVRVSRGGALRSVTLGIYGPGEILGDYSLMPPGKNVSTCRMATAGRLFQLPLGPAREMIAAQAEIRSALRRWIQLNALAAYLRNENFLGFMSAPSALELRELISEIDFPAATTIQSEGLADDRWYFLVEGDVEVTDDTTAHWTTRRLSKGDFFGERALLCNRRVPTAVALTAVRCLCLTRGAFDVFGEGDQTVPVKMINRDLPWIGQEAVADCGLAALAMVSAYHDYPVTVAQLRGDARLEAGGASMGELVRLAAALGFHAHAVEIRDMQFHLVRLPAVVHFRSGHYVVLYKYEVSGVTLGDPAASIVRLSRDAFHKNASGAVLVFGGASS